MAASGPRPMTFVLDPDEGTAKGSWRTQPQPFEEHVIIKTVQFNKKKIPKAKGKNKMSQHVKKRLMQKSMVRKSGVVGTKEGLALVTYGTYGPTY